MTISSSSLSEASASRMVAKWREPGMCFAWYSHSPRAITRRKGSWRSSFCFNSSRLMVLISPSFRVPRDPTAPALLLLRRYSGTTPVGPALAEKGRTVALQDGVGLHQDAPEALGVDGVVRRVDLIDITANGILHFAGQGVDRDLDPQGMQAGHEFPVKRGDGSGDQWQR